MNQPNLSHQLDQAVDDLLQCHKLSTFRYYWELYKRTFPQFEIQAHYSVVGTPTEYANAVILGDGKVIDIEGDDETDSGYLAVQDVASIGSVVFHRGHVEGFSRSQGASLVVFTRLVGETDSGPYWVARTELEEDRLIMFARRLVDSLPRADSLGGSK